MILNRLGVRGKLNLLLLLPLAAVVLVTVPFVAAEVGSARSAATTANAALRAKQAGALVSELQREGLMTAVYLVSPTADQVDLRLQYRRVADVADALRASLGPDAPEELLNVLVRLDTLDELRQSALERRASIDRVYRAYDAVIEAIIDALQLGPQQGGDAEGTRQLSSLDALLRGNEQAALRGIALIIAAIDPQIGLHLLDESSAQSQMLAEQFVQQADVDHAALLVEVEQGETAQRVDALVQQLQTGATNTLGAFVSDASASVESQAGLRVIVQDRVTAAIAQAAARRASAAQGAAWAVGLGAAALFVVVVALSIIVSRSIADPLRRLTSAATAVANLADAELVRVDDAEGVDEQPPQLAAITVSSSGEVGDLAAAFNRVQTTAARLLERQIVSRRNVSLMFANVAQRTQNLVNRQLALVDELERNEQNAQLLASLYQLDHLSARMRRSTENLLIVAGVRNETGLVGPTALATVLRSALSEIEDYQRIRIGEVYESVVVAPLVSDLIMVFAELIENATLFSPPESLVEVTALLRRDGLCEVNVIDHGIGIAPQQLAEENERLVARERLDIAPTTVLGLFVVGRLARRHSLRVELAPTPGGGVTARVAIPPALLSAGGPARSSEMGETLHGSAALHRRQMLPLPALVASLTPNNGFSWFSLKSKGAAAPDDGQPAPVEQTKGAELLPAVTVTPAQPSAHGQDAMPRASLNRRVPGAQIPTTATPAAEKSALPPTRDAAAARVALDDYQSALIRAATAPTVPSLTYVGLVAPDPPNPGHARGRMGRETLARRTPGAHLAPGLRDQPAGAPPRRTVRPERDPEAERTRFDAYATGIARALAQTDDGLSHPDQ